MRLGPIAFWVVVGTLVIMALSTGARRGDLLQLRWRDIDFDRRQALKDDALLRDFDTRQAPAVTAEATPEQRLLAAQARAGRPLTPEKEASIAAARVLYRASSRFNAFSLHCLEGAVYP